MKKCRAAVMFLLTGLIGVFLAEHTHAQDGRDTPDTFRVFVGGFFADMDTETQVTSGGLGGQTVDLERDLGLDDDDVVVLFGGRWRIGRRHSIGLAHTVLDRDADQTLTRDVMIGDDIFTINGMTMTTFDYETTHLDYRYAFWSSDRLDAGVLIGVSDIDFEFEVVGEAMAPGGGTVTGSVTEEEDFPVPSVGLGFRYVISEDWYLRAGATYFEYEDDDDDWEGSMLLGTIGVEWFPWRNFGFGLDYSTVEIEYDEDDDDPDEFDVDFEYNGIQLRAIGRF